MKKAVFDTLIQNDTIEQINVLCEKAGLHQLYLFHNEYESNLDKVSFFAKSANEDTDLFLLANKEEEIATILNIDSEHVMLTPFDRIAAEFRRSAKRLAQLYTKDNKIALHKWYVQDEIDELSSSSLQFHKSQLKKPMPDGLWDNRHKRKREHTLETSNKKSQPTNFNDVKSNVVNNV